MSEASEVLLARYADCIFWLARYVERAENLARILDVNDTFSRDRTGAREWLPILQLFAHERAFFERYPAATQAAVLRFEIIDRENPMSLVNAIRAARENARTLRPLVSTEMWVQLNVFHNWLSSLDASELSGGRLAHLLSRVKEACQTHTGITEGTFFRDQGWYFYQLGRYMERADQTTRLLDIKYHLLLPSVDAVGSPVDVSQWNALLRSAAGYHAYRRLHSREMTPAAVAGFLILNRRFPRSVYLCVRETEMLLSEAKARYNLRGANLASEELDGLRGQLSALTIEAILAQGLHEFLDMIQIRLIAITRDISLSFFGYAPESADAAAA
jgi:uncharacterized alpha-E superfamily protein